MTNVPWGFINIHTHKAFNPYPAKLFYLNFHPLVVVSRYRDPQPQVVENYSYSSASASIDV